MDLRSVEERVIAEMMRQGFKYDGAIEFASKFEHPDLLLRRLYFRHKDSTSGRYVVIRGPHEIGAGDYSYSNNKLGLVSGDLPGADRPLEVSMEHDLNELDVSRRKPTIGVGVNMGLGPLIKSEQDLVDYAVVYAGGEVKTNKKSWGDYLKKLFSGLH